MKTPKERLDSYLKEYPSRPVNMLDQGEVLGLLFEQERELRPELAKPAEPPRKTRGQVVADGCGKFQGSYNSLVLISPE